MKKFIFFMTIVTVCLIFSSPTIANNAQDDLDHALGITSEENLGRTLAHNYNILTLCIDGKISNDEAFVLSLSEAKIIRDMIESLAKLHHTKNKNGKFSTYRAIDRLSTYLNFVSSNQEEFFKHDITQEQVDVFKKYIKAIIYYLKRQI